MLALYLRADAVQGLSLHVLSCVAGVWGGVVGTGGWRMHTLTCVAVAESASKFDSDELQDHGDAAHLQHAPSDRPRSIDRRNSTLRRVPGNVRSATLRPTHEQTRTIGTSRRRPAMPLARRHTLATLQPPAVRPSEAAEAACVLAASTGRCGHAERG